MELDTVDQCILLLLKVWERRDAGYDPVQLARVIRVDPSVVSARVARLQEAGIIRYDFDIPDPGEDALAPFYRVLDCTSLELDGTELDSANRSYDPNGDRLH